MTTTHATNRGKNEISRLDCQCIGIADRNLCNSVFAFRFGGNMKDLALSFLICYVITSILIEVLP